MASSSSSSIPNPEGDLISPREPKRKKARKLGTDDRTERVKLDLSRWRTQAEQQIYSTKLVEAIRQVRRRSNPPAATSASCAPVREAADLVLAVTAKGRTRWSRAILTTRLGLRMKRINAQHLKRKKARSIGEGRSKKPTARKKLPALQRKVNVLGRLVPGCSKLSFPSILDEATDYIAALEMQVRAMTALAGLLTGSGSLPAPSDRLDSNHSQS